MGKQFGHWQGVAYNLAVNFVTSAQETLEGVANGGDIVSIDFLALTVVPYFLAHSLNPCIARCAEFLKQMEGHRKGALLCAQIAARPDRSGRMHYHVLLETSDPHMCVKGTLVHVAAKTYEWTGQPAKTRDQGTLMAVERGAAKPGARRGRPKSPAQAPTEKDSVETGAQVKSDISPATDTASNDIGHAGYEWLDLPPRAKDK